MPPRRAEIERHGDRQLRQHLPADVDLRPRSGPAKNVSRALAMFSVGTRSGKSCLGPENSFWGPNREEGMPTRSYENVFGCGPDVRGGGGAFAAATAGAADTIERHARHSMHMPAVGPPAANLAFIILSDCHLAAQLDRFRAIPVL